ncbi:hypothetical protein [Parasitella parasitica]|uniref:Uncharacterized protein n=1 Tax=Parasitella parasitica TaxID=35722 RepID=A0A0B7N390_9FUNG|nr:hypothetical protein [Parasitella parasitica]
MQGLGEDIDTMTSASIIQEQNHIWLNRIRPASVSPMIHKVRHTPMFMWNALGGALNALQSMADGYLTRMVLMDHLDWFGPREELDSEIREMKPALQSDGQVY